MHLDVHDLRAFYYETPLGRAAQRGIRRQVARLWPDTRGQTTVGFGFAVPLLRPFIAQSRRVIGLMPAPQGVMAWPAGEPNISVLCEDGRWPLPTGIADQVVLMHGLETADAPAAVLQESARVLGPGGRLIVIVPNRVGLWARSEATPFGYGRPFSLGQLETLMKRNGFRPDRHELALFQPPSQRRFWLRLGPVLERVGQRLWRSFAGGVLIVEAGKEGSHPAGTPVDKIRAKAIPVLEGIGKPVSDPVPSRNGVPAGCAGRARGQSEPERGRG